MRNQDDFKLNRAQPLQQNTQNLTKQQCFGTTETWHHCRGTAQDPGTQTKDSLNIHGSKTWIHSVFWTTRGTALKTRESQLIIAIQVPWFSFISLTWLERHLSPQWTSKLTVTRLVMSSYFFGLRIQRVIYAPHMQSKLRVQFRVPYEETWAFSLPGSPTALGLLYLNYIDTGDTI